MSSGRDEDAGARRSWFAATAEVVGDLDNPFYDEERQRDVWNEASAVGLQAVLWLGLTCAAAMVWLGGGTGLPYAVAVLAVLGVASGTAVHHARTQGVDVDAAARVLRPRLVPYVLLLLVFLLGVLRAAPAGGFGRGLAVGLVAGAAAALLGLAWRALHNG